MPKHGGDFVKGRRKKGESEPQQKPAPPRSKPQASQDGSKRKVSPLGNQKVDATDRSLEFTRAARRFSEQPALTYTPGMRGPVFEVIVRQAMSNAEWRETCAVPMHTFRIMPEEVEAEVYRRIHGYFS